MAPGRVMAVPPGASKRLLELDEPVPCRVTRQKAKVAAVTNHEESMLHQEVESSPHRDEGYPSMDEGSTVHTQRSPVAHDMCRSQQLECTANVEVPHQPMHNEGEFI
jgi:hypothetical protein